MEDQERSHRMGVDNHMKHVRVLLAVLLCLVLCFGCGKKEDKKQGAEGLQSEEAEKGIEAAADDQAETDPRTANEIIANAMEKTSKLAAFKTSTKGSLILGGKTIKGEFGMESQIHVVQGEDRQNLQMTMETKISPVNLLTRAYYKDGWYYTDDGKNKEKQEKSPEEVLGIVTDITDMVIDTSGQIENISVKEDGEDKIYSYELPSYIAEDYIAEMLKKMGAEDTVLEDASVEVESLKLASTVNGDGILIRQEISAAGKLKKAIVSVPVEAELEAGFAETDEKELEMDLW